MELAGLAVADVLHDDVLCNQGKKKEEERRILFLWTRE